MLYLIIGENDYKAEQELPRLMGDSVSPERYDGAMLTEGQLLDIVMGGTLFASSRTVIITDLSGQKDLWNKLAEWHQSIGDTTLIMRERSVDKRTKAYKTLAKAATVVLAEPWTDRMNKEAEVWLAQLAEQHGAKLSTTQVSDMVKRAYVPSGRPGQSLIDQMQLARAISTLSVLDAISDQAIATVLPPATNDAIFALLDYAVKKDTTRTTILLADLHTSSDPYLVFAALAKQWSQLVGVLLAGSHARELPIHPYVLSNLQGDVEAISRNEATVLTRLAARLDEQVKRSDITPWEAVDRFVIGVLHR